MPTSGTKPSRLRKTAEIDKRPLQLVKEKDEEIKSLKHTCAKLEEKLEQSSQKYKDIEKLQKDIDGKLKTLVNPHQKQDLRDEDKAITRKEVFFHIEKLEKEIDFFRRKDKTDIELKIEELETRVTELGGLYYRLKLSCLSVNQSLHKALEMDEPEQIKTLIKSECLESCYKALDDSSYTSTSYRTPLDEPWQVLQRVEHDTAPTDTDIATDVRSYSNDLSDSTNSYSSKGHSAQFSSDSNYPRNLVRPAWKGPGDTHIRKMDSSLRNYLIEELSQEKASKCDWRQLGLRVGLSQSTISAWEELHLPSPASQVWAFWGDSEGATVRMLHRHLRSPDMQAVLLAKYVTDFYEVD